LSVNPKRRFRDNRGIRKISFKEFHSGEC
jgi:hypothetical protein